MKATGSRSKDKNIAKPVLAGQEEPSQLRRTSRLTKIKNDDCYLMGHHELQRAIGFDPLEDQVGAKRPRKNYFYEDGSDYSDHKRSSKKKYRNGSNSYRCPPINPVEGLLKWREELLPIKIATKDNSKLIKVKSICKQQLDKHAQGIEALFVNIEWNKKGQKLEDFKNLKIQSRSFMEKGLIFIWTAKNLLADIIEVMENKGFQYVQNLQVALLDRTKAEQIYSKKKRLRIGQCVSDEEAEVATKKSKNKKSGIKEQIDSNETEVPFCEIVAALDNVQPNELVCKIPSRYFNSSRKTLFIFRKTSDDRVQLRHQRTCDVVFDMPRNPEGGCEPQLKAYLFNMIETMLPRCLEEDRLRMMELWGDAESRRRGWVTMMEQ